MKWNHHKPILCYLKPIKGYYYPEISFSRRVQRQIEFKIPNKGYRNMAFWLNSFLTNSTQTLIDTGGSSRSVNQFYMPGSASVESSVPEYGGYFMAYGSSSSPHDVTRFQLYSLHSALGHIQGVSFLEESSTLSSFKTYNRYIFPAPSLACGESGFYIHVHAGTWVGYAFMLARVIISPAVTKEYNTLYEEGWSIDFPANYTRVLPRMLAYCRYYGFIPKTSFTDSTGTFRIMRAGQPSAGSPDVVIGSDNSPPSPDDYNLKSSIGSLSNQSQTVEIDTSLQECRIIRQGTITPSTNITLGEVGLFINVVDSGGTARRAMIARGTFDPPIVLEAGYTYTVGIVLRLG